MVPALTSVCPGAYPVRLIMTFSQGRPHGTPYRRVRLRDFVAARRGFNRSCGRRSALQSPCGMRRAVSLALQQLHLGMHQVAEHRGLGAGGVATLDAAEDGAVVVDRQQLLLGELGAAAQDREDRAEHVLPETLHHADDPFVVRRARDAQVKHAIRLQHLPMRALAVPFEQLHRLRELGQLGLGARTSAASAATAGSSSRRALITSNALGPASTGSRARRCAFPRAHIGAGADAHLDQAGDLQRDQGFAHGRTADAETVRKVAFGRQARADANLPASIRSRDPVGDLLIKRGVLGLDRHQSLRDS